MMTPLDLTWPKSVYTHFFREIQHCWEEQAGKQHQIVTKNSFIVL